MSCVFGILAKVFSATMRAPPGIQALKHLAADLAPVALRQELEGEDAGRHGQLGEVIEGRHVLHQELDIWAGKLLPVLLEAGLDVEAHIICPLFSNRPFGVKHFQTIRRCGVDVAHGLVLLFGIGTRALPSWDSRTTWSDLRGGLTV